MTGATPPDPRGKRAHRLAVIVVAFHSREFIDRCLCSIAEHATLAGQPAETWVIDNASGDGTADLVRRRHPGVRLVTPERNLGFSAANNLALRQIRSEFVLILNPDTELHAGTVPALVGLLGEQPRAGMAGCRLVRPDGSFDHAARRSFPTVTGALGHFTGVGRRRNTPAALAQYRAIERDGVGPVDAINGAFMLIRRAALDEVGLFDEGYWLYMEDLDLCYRFRQHGWDVIYDPRVSALHVKGASSPRHRRWRQNRAFHYGMYRFYRKFYAPNRPALINGVVYGGIATKLGVSTARGTLGAGVRGRRGR